MSRLYLGFDFSTQQLKAVCIDDTLVVTHQYSVVFDSDLPEFRTIGGVVKGSDGLTVTAPTIMWVKALDYMLQKMQMDEFPFNKVVAISGSGQQHGSVYWKKGAQDVLKNLAPNIPLAKQIDGLFSIPDSPIWMDSSTSAECRMLEEACGGPQELANKTGSKAYERFTGNQIAKIYKHKDLSAYQHYDDTERISLVSSFGASLLLGLYASIDYSDGSGMNLLDIFTKDWWPKALDSCAPNLRECLGSPVPTTTILGTISSYFVHTYGFSDSCKVVAFTGDNPASLAGMRLQPGDIAISLGTSDTAFVWIDQALPQLMGHVFVNPVDQRSYMAMLCYKNGSRTREAVKSMCGCNTWESFNELLRKTPPGNHGNIGIYFLDPEIIPSAHGTFLYNAFDQRVDSFAPEVAARAIIEGQIIAKYVHTRNLGFNISCSSRVLATGGASTNTDILQVVANVFNCNVFILKETANSASLGAAYIAKYALVTDGSRFSSTVSGAPAYSLAVSPDPAIHQVYLPLIERYAVLESRLT